MDLNAPGVKRELNDIIVADLVLSLAFDFALMGGAAAAFAVLPTFLYLFPMTFFAVSLAFILHEMMHKFTAQRFGAIAGFRKSSTGVLITLITGFFGFLIGIPGATVIFTDQFTTKESGIVSLAGPMTNFAIFIAFYILGSVLFPANFTSQILNVLSIAAHPAGPYLLNVIDLTLFISILLAFFNMLPIQPLDGSKVLHWSTPVYVVTIAVIFIMLAQILPLGTIFFSLVFMLAIALFISFMYRGFAI